MTDAATQDALLSHLDDVRRRAHELGDEDEGSLAQIPVLRQIVTSAQAAIDNLTERGLAFLDGDLREYKAVQARADELADDGSNDEEINKLREVNGTAFGCLDLALRLLGKPGLEG